MKVILLAGFLASRIVVSSAFAQASHDQTSPEREKPGQMQLAASSSAPLSPAPSAATPLSSTSAGSWHAREGTLYRRNWGVDIIGVRRLASGFMLRFSYRVLDLEKAKALNDENATAYLIDEATGAKLMVPTMEKIGKLRTTNTPQVNRNYWMIFGNPGMLVKPGNRVSVVIGDFRVDGLVVE